MRCGPTDMHREEERRAAGLVKKCCRNCDYRKCNMGSLCLNCSNKSNFIPSRAAISAKLEELRNQTAVKQDSSSKSEESGKNEGEESKDKIVNITKIIHANGEEEESQDIFNVSDFFRLMKLEAERREMIECLKDAHEVIDYMGDILNSMDVVNKDDEEFINPKIRKINSMLNKAEGR